MDRPNSEKLISYVKNHRELWDLNNPDYTNRSRKEHIWRGIASKLGYPVDEVKRRWDSLRASYRGHLKRKETDNPDLKWHFANELSFLKEQIFKIRHFRGDRIKKSDTREINKKLISLVKQYPALWDTSDEAFHNLVGRKQVIWQKIAKQLGDRVEQIKARWWRLRHNYIKALEKKKKWPLESDMAFIQAHLCRGQHAFVSVNEEFMDELSSSSIPEVQGDTESKFSEPFDLLEVKKERFGSDNEILGYGAESLRQFFLSLAEIVANLPPLVQAKVKAEVFESVNAAEMSFLEAKMNCGCQEGEQT